MQISISSVLISQTYILSHTFFKLLLIIGQILDVDALIRG